ncbi:MAG: phage tail protein [Deferribacterales bacterium]
MSKFYQYFSQTLRFPFLRAGSAFLSLVKGIAVVLDEMLEKLNWVRDQFVPSKCETQYLRHFADSRSIKRYSFETDEQYRGRICAAYVFFAQAGKDAGVQAIFALYGLPATIESLRDTDEERWAEFYLIFADVTGEVISSTDEYIQIMNDVKPARSKLAGVKYNLETDGTLNVMSGLQTSSMVIVQPGVMEDFDIAFESFTGMYVHTVNRIIVGG